MIERSETARRIAGILAMLNLDIPSDDTDLIQSGLMDSLLLVELLTRIEQELGVSVPVDQLEPEDFRSIESIAAFVLASQKPSVSAHRA